MGRVEVSWLVSGGGKQAMVQSILEVGWSRSHDVGVSMNAEKMERNLNATMGNGWMTYKQEVLMTCR